MGGQIAIMRLRLKVLYLIVLLTLSSDRIKLIITNDDKWFFKVLEVVFILVYLFVLSKLLIKISSFYTAIPKESDRIHLQPWGRYYIDIILIIYIGLYIIAINAPKFDFFYIVLGIIIGYDDGMYQVVYKRDNKMYFYFEKDNMSKEIISYDTSDKYVNLDFIDGEHLNIITSYKTKKNKQQIRGFFE